MQDPECLFHLHMRLVAGLFFCFVFNDSSGNYSF